MKKKQVQLVKVICYMLATYLIGAAPVVAQRNELKSIKDTTQIKVKLTNIQGEVITVIDTLMYVSDVPGLTSAGFSVINKSRVQTQHASAKTISRSLIIVGDTARVKIFQIKGDTIWQLNRGNLKTLGKALTYTVYKDGHSNDSLKVILNVKLKADSLLEGTSKVLLKPMNKRLILARAGINALDSVLILNTDKEKVRDFLLKLTLEDGELAGAVKKKVYVLKSENTTGSTNVDKLKEPASTTLKPKAKVHLFPNPTTGKFVLSLDLPQKSAIKVRVVNSQGKSVYENEAGEWEGLYNQEIDLSTFEKGLYIVQIFCGGRGQSERLLLQ